MAVFDPSAYDCLQSLLDELYMEYLHESFAPLTYGSSWLLEERTERPRSINPKRLAVPWKWLKEPIENPLLNMLHIGVVQNYLNMVYLKVPNG